MEQRPLTQAEIAKRDANRVPEEYITIVNRSNKQTVPIQLKAPKGVSFWNGEQSINLYPKQMAKFPKSRLYIEQIINCQKSGLLKVLEPLE